MVTRRSVLFAGAAALAAAGAGGYALLRAPLDTARAPWERAGGFADPRLNVLSWAVLAPSPHNRQPWRIALSGGNAAQVFCDLDSRLPRTDPLDRQITIGFGAFLELARMAAGALAQGLRIDPFPSGAPDGRLDARPVADLAFAGAPPARDRLFDHALDRRTTRAPFDMDDRPDDAALARLAQEAGPGVGAGWAAHEDAAAPLRALCRQAWAIEHGYAPTRNESTALTRIGSAAVNAQPDGVSITGPVIEALRLSGAFTKDALKRADSWASAQVHDVYAAQIAATPAFLWITTPGDSAIERLQAGRAWLRIQIAAARDGWAVHPVSQPLQEFEPMRPLLAALHERLAPDGARVQGLFRIGRAPSPDYAPRWPLETRLIDPA